MRFFDIFPFLSFPALVFMILVKTIVLKNKGVVTSAKSSKQPIIKMTLYLVFISIMFLLIFELLKSAFQFSFTILPDYITNPLIQNKSLQLLGIVLLCISLIFMIFTLIHFKNSLRFGMNKTNLGELITTGIFSCSRNPFFLSIDIYFVALAILYPNIFFLSIALLTIVSIHFFIRKEEVFLSDNYGEKYKDYTKKVRRYF